MRDPRVIASEIDRARHDLDENLGELRALVRSKLDVKQRARHAARRAVGGARTAVQRTGATLRQHAAITAIAVGVVVTLAWLLVRRRRT